jgi:rare lipoprotein A
MVALRQERLVLLALILSFTSACASLPGGERSFGGRSTGSPVDTRDLIARSSDHQKIGNAYTIGGRRYVPQRDDNYDETGIASWYGPNFHGRPTANGEIFDQNLMTAAHTTLPIPSIAEVTNLENGRTVIVRINDRGPFVDDRMIDLSRAAATELDYQSRGLARVRVRYLGPAQPHGRAPARQQYARADLPVPTPVPTPAPVAIAPSPTMPSTMPPAMEPVSQPLDEGYADWSPDEPAMVEAPVSEPVVFEAETYDAPITEPAPLTLQVGAFSDRTNAESFASRLDGAGEVWVAGGQSAGRDIYRVFVGRWADRTQADQARTLLENWGVYDARVVTLD